MGVYALILEALVVDGRGPSLRPGGALVLEVPSCLESRVQRLVENLEGLRGADGTQKWNENGDLVGWWVLVGG